MKKVLYILMALVYGVTGFAQNTNISQGNIFEGEPYIAINPTNTQHIAIAWMGWASIAEQFKIKTSVSFDGGKTWSSKVEIPHTQTGFSSADPCLAFDSKGNLFLSFIDFTGTAPPVTGGVYLSKSLDGGLSWQAPNTVITTDYDGTKWPIDRPWMVIDNSGKTTNGTIYITTMNLNRTNPSFRPYLSTSIDGGTSFTQSYVDGENWLAGSLNPLPLCSPVVASDGTFYGAYPSLVLSQNLRPHAVLAKSTSSGSTFTYSLIKTVTDAVEVSAYSDAKKAGLLLANPADSAHLTSVYLSAENGDLDVYYIETKNAGTTWSSPKRINDDPIANNRMQDLLWGAYDEKGNLVVTWRDRRNGDDSTFATQSEIWAAYKANDTSDFGVNFELTSATPDYDSILTRSGNDFMSVALANDTIHATWGETRSGSLNIWYTQYALNSGTASHVLLLSEPASAPSVFPNPARDYTTIEYPDIIAIELLDLNGKKVLERSYTSPTRGVTIDTHDLASGTYTIILKCSAGTAKGKLMKD